MATGVATATEAMGIEVAGAVTATEAMEIEVVGAVMADGMAAGVEVVAAWGGVTGAVPAPAGRVDQLLCRSGRTKMKDDSPQEQDAFLNTMRSDGTSVSVYLVNGIRLVGLVQSFDRHMVLLSSPAGVQLIYKHAISTVQPEPERVRPVPTESSETPSSHETMRAPVVVTRKRRSPPTK
jgi:host factor-I protein